MKRNNFVIEMIVDLAPIFAAAIVGLVCIAVNDVVINDGIARAASVSLVTGLLGGLLVGALAVARARAEHRRWARIQAQETHRRLTEILDGLADIAVSSRSEHSAPQIAEPAGIASQAMGNTSLAMGSIKPLGETPS